MGTEPFGRLEGHVHVQKDYERVFGVFGDRIVKQFSERQIERIVRFLCASLTKYAGSMLALCFY